LRDLFAEPRRRLKMRGLFGIGEFDLGEHQSLMCSMENIQLDGEFAVRSIS
jgi:hypothetical protein